ncbi:MAG: GGDEF domain-containing protein [Magnetococcus sp. DMHC-6]
MGILVNLKCHTMPKSRPVLLSRKPSNLILELDRYRRKSEELAKIYELHRQLGEQLDLASMIEALSAWLMPYFKHSLLAYSHPTRNRIHISCSCHGPLRTKLITAAYTLFETNSNLPKSGFLEEIELYYDLPRLNNDWGSLLILHDQPNHLSNCQELSIIFLEELHGPLERALAYEDLYDQARRDALTGLVNRRVFQERLTQEIANSQRYGNPLALAGLDLDHFKEINDHLGHAEGDQTLLRVSQILAKMIRDSDLLARIGGDEFALILPNTDLDNGKTLMNRLCQAVRALNIQVPGFPPLGVSIGLTLYQPGLSQERWLEQVDQALYRAKAEGRSRVSI